MPPKACMSRVDRKLYPHEAHGSPTLYTESKVLASRKATVGQSWADIYQEPSGISGHHDRKPLPPVPPDRYSYRTSEDYYQAKSSEDPHLQLVELPTSIACGPRPSFSLSQSWKTESNQEDYYLLNKPLPLSPLCQSTASESSQSTDRGTGSLETQLYAMDTENLHRTSGLTTSSPVHCAAEISESLLVPPLKLYRQPAAAEDTDKLSARQLLTVFFGFDFMNSPKSFSNARLRRVRYYLTIQPEPHTVLRDTAYPVVACAWLRKLIVNSLHELEFDRGRRYGLMLEDHRTQNVHRGFGLLWNFLEACGPTIPHETCTGTEYQGKSKPDQLDWFQHRDIQPSEAEHMLQIWNALKTLLLQHSAAKRPQFIWWQRRAESYNLTLDGENVVSLMKHGLGKVQQYLASLDPNAPSFPNRTSPDGFFEEACAEWRDYVAGLTSSQIESL